MALLEAELAKHLPQDGGPRLRVVPPVADEPTPIRDRELIEAWIEDVRNWGEDVES